MAQPSRMVLMTSDASFGVGTVTVPQFVVFGLKFASGPLSGYVKHFTLVGRHEWTAVDGIDAFISMDIDMRPKRPSRFFIGNDRRQTRGGGGRGGGVRNAGGLVRSSALSGSFAAPSRLVSEGRFHFRSISLRMDV